MLTFTSHSPQQTEQFAKELAPRLKPGDVLAFTGGMGAGKTAFTRGLAAGLSVSGEVASPTFSIVNVYPGQKGGPSLFHFDMYRITDPDELETTGFFDYLEDNGILVVEWSEHIADDLPPERTIFISIDKTGENTRTITVKGGGRF